MSKKRFWTGIVITGLVVAFLTFDAVIHMSGLPFVVDSFVNLGYSPSIALPIGIIEFLFLILLVIPRTSILGALFLTGYLGGAVATNVRVGAPLFSNILFPVYVAIFLWIGLLLLVPRLHTLLPLKK